MTAAGQPLLQLDEVCMDFGTIRAVDRASFEVRPGEVVGLVGDNGAGKSTLIKIITGFHRPTAGELRFDGRPVQFRSPADARAVGIETVYQDLALVPELPLWRNFFLGKELYARIGPVKLLRIGEMRRVCQTRLAEMGLTRLRSADEIASVLSGGERQSLAIQRAVFFGARVLLLDEPTAALSVRETEYVFSAIESARERGLAIIYIDHNMAHVHPIADRIVYVEHGRVAATINRGEASIQDLISLLSRTPSQPRRPDLDADDVAVTAREAAE